MPTDDVIDLAELRQELIRPGGLWQKVDLVPETGSTNADLAERARQGEAPGTVLITDYQSAGRGRQGRRHIAILGAWRGHSDCSAFRRVPAPGHRVRRRAPPLCAPSAPSE